MPDRDRVIVAGGSVAGLFAGAALARRGLRVDVFERAGEELASRGAGIATHPELFDALAEAGAALDEGIGVKIRGRITLARDGTIRGEHPLPQTVTSWDRLHAVLRQAFPADRYHAGSPVEGFAQDEDGVTVRLAGGREERAGWLVGADGIRSTIRRRLLPGLAPTYSGYVAWRGLVEEGAMSAEAWAVLGEHMAFCLPPGEQMLGYPVPGAGEEVTAGRRRYNFVWYRPGDAVRGLPEQPTAGSRHARDPSVAPDRIPPEAVVDLREAAARLLAPPFAEVVRLTPCPFIQAIYDLEVPRLVFGRVLLVGDAAFVARPHAGMGATKAALDAVTLARALAAAEPAPALAAWERERLRYGRAVVERSRRLGAYLAARAAGTHEPPDAAEARAGMLMAETASSGWLHR